MYSNSLKKNVFTGFEKNERPKRENMLGKKIEIAIVSPIIKQNNEKGSDPDEPDFPNGENPSSNNLPNNKTNHIDTVIYQNSTENISIPSHAHDTWLFDDGIYVSDEDDYYILNNLPIPIHDGN